MDHTNAAQSAQTPVLSVPSNRRMLKQNTQHSHIRAEGHWTKTFDLNHGFRHFFNAMYGLHVEFGVRAAEIAASPGALDVERTRIAALRLDLGASFEPPASKTARKIDDTDTAWGVLYALNGSAMGAMSLLQTNAPEDKAPSHYLNEMRDYAHSGALGRFFRALNAHSLDMARATAGADAVFDAMSRHAGMEKVKI